MINGKTLVKRDVFNKPRGEKRIGSIGANVTIAATENKYQWLHLVNGGWVSAGPQQQYIKWVLVPDPIVNQPPKTRPGKITKGTTLVTRDVFNKPRGEKRIGSIDANVTIKATENVLQWLHLIDGGWISAGPKQQYIKWRLVPDTDDTQPPAVAFGKIIKGKTKIKRDVFDKPRSKKRIRTINANVNITATENIFQWLHLVDGGWVSAGSQQQYIKWDLVPDLVGSQPPAVLPDPVITPSPPKEPWAITEIKRKGKVATLLADWQNPKWDFTSRPRLFGTYFNYPQTVTFNSICVNRKGTSIPLSNEMTDYLDRLNGQKTKEIILTIGAGWINRPTIPGTVERLTWAANHVVVKETKVEQGVEYSNVYALNCHETDIIGSFFDKDMRLIVHKFNAVTRSRNLIKLTNGRDCYTPFITDPNINNGDMWIRSDYLEMWPELPFTLSDGTQIIEYELFGYLIYGLRSDGKSILLRDPSGFKTNWKINSPEVPI